MFRVVTGIFLLFVNILCFMSLAMTIIVVHLYTNSIAVKPSKVPETVSTIFNLLAPDDPGELESLGGK